MLKDFVNKDETIKPGSQTLPVRISESQLRYNKQLLQVPARSSPLIGAQRIRRFWASGRQPRQLTHCPKDVCLAEVHVPTLQFPFAIEAKLWLSAHPISLGPNARPRKACALCSPARKFSGASPNSRKKFAVTFPASLCIWSACSKARCSSSPIWRGKSAVKFRSISSRFPATAAARIPREK